MGTRKNVQAERHVELPDLLAKAGLPELRGPSEGEETGRWLRRFGARAPASAVDRSVYREQGVTYLSEVDFGSPASMIDAALSDASGTVEVQEDTLPTATEEELLERARPILEAEDQLALFSEQLQAEGFAGDTAGAELLYLAITSRLLERPINIVVLGPSGSGKTHLVKSVMAYHPDEAAHWLTAASEKALLYTEFDTEHAVLVISEGDALAREGVGATVIREISWSGEIRYEVANATSAGVRNERIVKPGPTGLITTSTHPLEPELATRLLEVRLSEDEDQTRAIMESLALEAAGHLKPPSDKAAWHAMQRWLGCYGRRRVVVPFAPDLARLMPADRLRMRRDFVQALKVLQAHTLLHQWHRAVDDQGRVVADERDYLAVERLLAPVFQRSRREGLTAADRKLLEAVTCLNRGLPAGAQPGVSVTDLAEHLGLDKSAVSRRASRLEQQGHLKNLQERSGVAYRYVLGSVVARETSVFPSADLLFMAAKDQRAA